MPPLLKHNIRSLLLAGFFFPLAALANPCEVLDSVLMAVRETSGPYVKKRAQFDSLALRYQQANCPEGVANITREIGTLELNEEHGDTALFYFRSAWQQASGLDAHLSAGSVAHQLGKYFLYQEHFDSALLWFQQAESRYQQAQASFAEAIAATHLAATYWYMDSLPQAYAYCQRIRHYARATGDTSNQAYARQIEALIDLDSLGVQPHIVPALRSTLAFFRQQEDTEGRLTLCENLGLVFSQQQQYDSALTYYTLASQWADSLNNKRYLSAMNERITHLGTLIHQRNQLKTMQTTSLSIILAALALFGVLLFYHLRQRRRLLQQELDLRNHRIDRLLHEVELKSTQSLLQGQDRERKRIAEELHDRLGSTLAAVKMHFHHVQEQLSEWREQNDKQYARTEQLIDQACDEVRRISHDLYSGILIQFGLTAALEELCETLRQTGLEVHLPPITWEKRLNLDWEMNLYRIVQELVANTLKHSQASHITIQLNRTNGQLTLMYEDNGSGFEPSQTSSGMGLENIRNRAERMHGSVHFDSRPGHGMTAIVEIPAETTDTHDTHSDS